MSDIHGNLQALDACLRHARAQQAQRLGFLGDLVGYGGNPAQVVERIMLLTEEGAVVHQGQPSTPWRCVHPAEVNTVGDSTAAWTHQQLSVAQRTWLDGLPMTAAPRQAAAGACQRCDQPEQWRYVTDERAASGQPGCSGRLAEVRYVLGGRVHEQTPLLPRCQPGPDEVAPQAGVAIAGPRRTATGWAPWARCGQPRDGKPEAMYALIDTERAQLTFHRVPYDHQARSPAPSAKRACPSILPNGWRQGR